MGFPWYSKTDETNTIDWVKVGKSFDKYFAKLGTEGCCLELDDNSIFVFNYEDMKVGDGEGNYYE